MTKTYTLTLTEKQAATLRDVCIWVYGGQFKSPSPELSRAEGVGLNELLGRWPGERHAIPG